MIAKEDRPLATSGDGRRLIEDIDNREAVFHLDGHEDARHQRKMEGHVAFVAAAEIGGSIFRPLVRFRQEDAVFEGFVEMGAQLLEKAMSGGEIFAVGPFLLKEIGNRVKANAVNAERHPEIDHPQHLGLHFRVFEIEVRLMGIKTVPVVSLGDRIPRPVGGFKILKDNPRFAVLLGGVAPDIIVAMRRADLGMAGALEPGVLIGGVIKDQFGDDTNAAAVGGAQQLFKVTQSVVDRVDGVVVGDIITVVPLWRGVEREEPERRDPELLQVIEFTDQAAKIADAIGIGIGKSLDMQLVDHCIPVPEGIFFKKRVITTHKFFLHG